MNTFLGNFKKHIVSAISLKLEGFYILLFIICLLGNGSTFATDYYFHPTKGNDKNSGLSTKEAFKSLTKVTELHLKAGDKLLLASGEVFNENLLLVNVMGSAMNPIIINSFYDDNTEEFALIDAKGYENGILIENSSFIHIKNINISASGLGKKEVRGKMRVGVMLRANGANYSKGIALENLTINDVYFENEGFTRGVDEVKTANGTQRYGWGIRVMNNQGTGIIEDIEILNCSISNVSHTGIKLTGGEGQNIRNVNIYGNKVFKTGGPGIQMSRVQFVHVIDNEITYSGSNDDSRKWGRGSGLWTWGSSMIMIEKNTFMYANGPADSAGAHIDFNCDNVILQYNLSAYNAGGFCEILGNNYNCAYRYNVSVNDGHRVKGKNRAFQEGKVFWLSGFQGKNKARKGPVNSYFYNNTIFVSDSIMAKVAVENRSRGVLVANNIFHILGGVTLVKGDQYKPQGKDDSEVLDVFFENNIFIEGGQWPEDAAIQPTKSIVGDVKFRNPGGLSIEDYIPLNKELTSQGIKIPFIPNDNFGLMQGLQLKKDILGNEITGTPFIGAIVSKPDDN